MNINEFRIGCILKVFANYVSDSEEDISYVTNFISHKDYKNLVRYHSAGCVGGTRRTTFQYINYVTLRKIDVRYRENISKKMSLLAHGQYFGNIFKTNKIDPHVAPISARKRRMCDLQILWLLRDFVTRLTIEIPEEFPEIGINSFRRAFKEKRSHRVWSTWYVKNQVYFPSDSSLFAEFLETLSECRKWTNEGKMSFVFNQSNMSAGFRHVLAELENKDTKMATCMFLVLKRQQIQSILDLPRFYEETYDIFVDGIDKTTLYPIGFKEIHAYTLADASGTLTGRVGELFKRSKQIYDRPHCITYQRLHDEYEDSLALFISKRAICTLPKEIHDDFFRHASERYTQKCDFFGDVLK